jgi:hypothetical protein
MPEINPNLVTLSDSGALPTPTGGGFAWFGDNASGTYCGPDYGNLTTGDDGTVVTQVTEPDTSGSGPSGLIDDRSPTFTFSSDDAGASFECSLDGGTYTACSSPYSPSGLGSGAHTLSVRAVSATGVPDSTPLSFSFSIAQALGDLSTPKLGKSVNVAVVSGKVLVKLPGGKFVALDQARQIKTGSVLDTTKGVVQLVSATGKGSKTQSGKFFQGVFKIGQSKKKRDKGLTVLSLVRGKFGGCGARASAARVGAHASKRTIRRVRGVAKGRFSTRGKNASATVRGTNWGTIDRCDGTLTKVRSGRVAVRDFVRKRTIILRAGQTYLAKARR